MYQRILVPIDGSPTAAGGLDEAVRLAGHTGASIRLIHVIDELFFAMGADAFGGGYTGDVITLLRESGEKILAEGRERVAAAGVPVDTVLKDSFAGRVCDLIVDEARDWPADLIVIGTHGRRGAGRLFLGSDAEQILRLATVPVLLVRGPAAAPPA